MFIYHQLRLGPMLRYQRVPPKPRTATGSKPSLALLCLLPDFHHDDITAPEEQDLLPSRLGFHQDCRFRPVHAHCSISQCARAMNWLGLLTAAGVCDRLRERCAPSSASTLGCFHLPAYRYPFANSFTDTVTCGDCRIFLSKLSAIICSAS